MVGLAYHCTANQFPLPPQDDAVYLIQTKAANNKQPIRKHQRGDTMADNRIQDYFDDNNQGHVDTREANFQCENPDEHLVQFARASIR